MSKRPSPLKPQPTPLSWDIYRAASKAKWIGSVELGDRKGGQFKVPAAKLIAVRRR
jgi:hypothetical protein